VIREAISNGIMYALAVIEQGQFEKHQTKKHVQEQKNGAQQTFQLIGMQVAVLNKLQQSSSLLPSLLVIQLPHHSVQFPITLKFWKHKLQFNLFKLNITVLGK